MVFQSKKITKIIAAVFICVFTLTPVFQAQAFPTITTKDIPRMISGIFEFINERALTHFANQYLEDLVNKIEESYKIANFLYYSDALVSGQYLQDYMDKYVQDAMDQRMVLAFVPQITCGRNIDISGELRKKAQDYLGYNPKDLKFDDPNFDAKLARMGDFYSSPAGWEQHYEGLAKKAAAEAKAAAQAEITSPGVKTGRTEATATTPTSISATVNSILNNQAAAIEAALKLGTDNAAEMASKIAQDTIFKYIKKFAFKGSVFKEQSVCIETPTLNPITPIGDQNREPDKEQTFIFVDPEFVKPSDDIFLTAKVNLTWEADTLKSKGAVKVRINDEGWYSLNGSEEITISFLGSDYSNFNCYKFVLEVYDKFDQKVNIETPMVAYAFNSRGTGPSDSNTFCGGSGGAQQPRG